PARRHPRAADGRCRVRRQVAGAKRIDGAQSYARPQQFRLNGPKGSAGTSFGQLQGLISPPGFGAGNTGFDSTNAAKKRKAKTVNKTGNKAGNKAGKPASPPGSPAPGAAATGTPAAPSDPS